MDESLNESDILVDSHTDAEISVEMVASEDSLQQVQIEEKSEVKDQNRLHCKNDIALHEHAKVKDKTSDCSSATTCSDDSPPKKQPLAKSENIVILSSDEEKEADTPSQCPTLPLSTAVVGESAKENVRFASDSEVDMFSSQLDSNQGQGQDEPMECEDIIPSSQEDIVEDISSTQISDKSDSNMTSRMAPCKRKLENGEQESIGKILCVEKQPSPCEQNASTELLVSSLRKSCDISSSRNVDDSDNVHSANGGAGDRFVKRVVRDDTKIIEESESEDEDKDKNIDCKNVDKDDSEVAEKGEVKNNNDVKILSADIKGSLESNNVQANQDANDAEAKEIVGEDISTNAKNQSKNQTSNSDGSEGKSFQLNFNLKMEKMITDTTLSLPEKVKPGAPDVNECDVSKPDAIQFDNSEDIISESDMFMSDEAMELNKPKQVAAISDELGGDVTRNTNAPQDDKTKSLLLNASVSVKSGDLNSDCNIKSVSLDYVKTASKSDEKCVTESDDLFLDRSELKHRKLERVELQKITSDASKSENLNSEPSKLENRTLEPPKSENLMLGQSSNFNQSMSNVVTPELSNSEGTCSKPSRPKDVTQLSKSEDVMAELSKSDDVIAEPSKSDDDVAESSKSDDDVAGPSKSYNVIANLSKSDFIAEPSKSGDVIAGSSKSGDGIVEPSKSEDVIAEPSKSENVIAEPSKSEDVIVELSKSENVIAKSSKPEDVIAKSSTPKNVLAEQTKSENVLAEKTNPEHVLVEQTKSENVVVVPSKSEARMAEPFKSEDMMTEPVKSKDMTEPSKPEDMMAEPSRSEDMMTEPSKSGDMMAEPSKSEDMMTEPSKSEDMMTEPSKSEDMMTEPSNSEDMMAEPSKSEDMTESSKSEDMTESSKSEDMTESSKSEDMMAEPYKSEDMMTEPSKSEDMMTEPSKSEDMTTEPPKPWDVTTERPKPGEVTTAPPKPGDVTTVPPKPGDVTTEPPKQGDVTTVPPKPGDVTTEPPKPVDVITEPPKPGDVMTRTSKSGDVTTHPSKPGNMTTHPSKSEDMIAVPHKSGDVAEPCKSKDEMTQPRKSEEDEMEKLKSNKLIAEPSVSKDSILQPLRPKDVISEKLSEAENVSEPSKPQYEKSKPSKVDEMMSESCKLLDKSKNVMLEPSKMRVVSEQPKLMEVITEQSKSVQVISDDVLSEVSKTSKGIISEASKLPKNLSQPLKLENVILGPSMPKNVAPDLYESKEQVPEKGNSENVASVDVIRKPSNTEYAISDTSESDAVRSVDIPHVSESGNGMKVASKSGSVTYFKSGSDSVSSVGAESSDSCEIKSGLQTLSEERSSFLKSGKLKLDFTKLNESKFDFLKSEQVKCNLSKLGEVISSKEEADLSKLEEVITDISESNDGVKSGVAKSDDKVNIGVLELDNGKQLKLSECRSLVKDDSASSEIVAEELKKCLEYEQLSSSHRVRSSLSPEKHLEDNNFVHPKITPKKYMGQEMEDDEHDRSVKPYELDISDSQDFNLCVSLSPNASTQSADSINLEKTSSKIQHNQDVEDLVMVENRTEILNEKKMEQSLKASSPVEKTDSDIVMSNGFSDAHEVMVCSPSDNKICNSENMDAHNNSIIIICEKDTHQSRKKDDSMTGQVKRKRQHNDADVIEYIDIAETPPEPEGEHLKKKLRTHGKDEKNSPLNSSELGLMGNNCAVVDSSFEHDSSTPHEKTPGQRVTAVQYRKIGLTVSMKIVYDSVTKEVLSRTVTQCEVEDDPLRPTGRSEPSSGYLADCDGKTSPGSVTSTGPYQLLPKHITRLSTVSSSSSSSGSFNSDMKNFLRSFGGSTTMPPPKEIPKERCPSRENSFDKSDHQISSCSLITRNYETVIQCLDQITTVDNLNNLDCAYHSDHDSKKSELKSSNGGEISGSSDANGHVKGEDDDREYGEKTSTPKTSRKTYTRVGKHSGSRLKLTSERGGDSLCVVNLGEKVPDSGSPARSPQVGRSCRRARNKLGFEDGKAASHNSSPSRTPGSSSDKKASSAGIGRKKTGPEKKSFESQVADRPKTPEVSEKPQQPDTPKSESFSSEPKTPETVDGVSGDQIEPGVPVFARWTDKKYYSGKVKNKVREKWLVEFDDGNSKVLIPDFIIVCTVLNRGQSVYAMDRRQDFHSGVVRDFELSKGEVVYGVELDDTEEKLFVPRSKISMSEDQASLLRESVYDTSCTSLTPKSLSSVTLDNLVEGKRARKRLQAHLERPQSSGTVSQVKPRRARSDASSLSDAGDKTSSASEFVGGVEPESYPCVDLIVACTDTGKTPTIRGKSVIKSLPKSKSKTSEDPDILSVLGPIPPHGSKIFSGERNCFLLTCSDIDHHVPITSKRKTSSAKKGKKRSSSDNSEVSSDDPGGVVNRTVPFDKNRLTKQLTAGGGTVYENFHDLPEDKYASCLLIANKTLQTAKYLLCLAHNIPIVQHSWVIDSVNKGSKVDHSLYCLCAGWSLEDGCYKEWKNCPRPSRKPLQNLSVYIVNEAGIFFKFWNKILTALGASATHVVDIQDLTAKPDVILTDLSCFEDMVREAKLSKIPLVSTTWVVQCLINWRRCGYNAHSKYSYDAPD